MVQPTLFLSWVFFFSGNLKKRKEEEMKLSLLPPLLILCSDLILQPTPPLLTALPLPTPTAHSFSQTGNLITVSRTPNKIYHPLTGSCVLRTSLSDPLKLGACDRSDAWKYTPQKFLVVGGTYFCLQAAASGEPARLSIICSESDSQWDLTPNAKSYVSTKLEDGSDLCLDVDSENTLVTNPCLYYRSGDAMDCNSDSQLFEFGGRS
ncbi:uncharacterized protein LOC109709953 [Ananas comosus]|uniref:Uncharacterized protein LOC109709953 n=1 Tax=Ananas comosus TaxID=4615 RepID=A0A6P5EVY2_ANACO|nr:uncharacterized protein LOC109709953 [Ananas comosus]